MQRIGAFFDEDEVAPWACSLSRAAELGDVRKASPLSSESSSGPPAVGFVDATFRWDKHFSYTQSLHRELFELGPLDLIFPSGKLSLVTGATGSGKSALLAALLGELYTVSGDVIIDKSGHKVAYAAQNPCEWRAICHG